MRVIDTSKGLEKQAPPFGVTQSTLHRWLYEDQVPSEVQAARIAEVLDVDLGALTAALDEARARRGRRLDEIERRVKALEDWRDGRGPKGRRAP